MLGLIAGGITSVGFIPQILKGYRTKKLDDLSYLMLLVLAVGMTLWLIYGIMIDELPVIVANIFGGICTIFLIIMKKMYSLKK